jgi:alkyldihydroxyacetonephosphate synthase
VPSTSALAALAERLPPGALTTDPEDLLERSTDWSPLAFLRGLRAEPGEELPAAVAFPSSTEDVAAVLAWANETGSVVVPRGGGSGVCGGAEASTGSVVLDLTRMDRVLNVDEESRVVHVEAGVRGDRLEATLAERGLTVGHYPQSIALSTVGGWIAASSAGQASAGCGSIEDLVLGVTAVLPGGSIIRLRPVPRSAAGPDLRRLLIGSEGRFGVVTQAFLSCTSLPGAYVWDAFGFDTFDLCMAWMRAVVAARIGPAVVRAYDEVDSTLAFGTIGHTGGCAAIIGFDTNLPAVDERRRAAAEAARETDGKALGPSYGTHWWDHRNDSVDLYRRIMGAERAFGSGVVVDTMEVAGLWRDLPELYRAVRGALSRRADAVSCHLSHAYPSGSSLYFTFLIRASDDHEAERTYLAAWKEAVRACHAGGGTMTHHHGVGRLKAGFLREELGDGGLEMLRAIGEALDPAGILNPGALIPSRSDRHPPLV